MQTVVARKQGCCVLYSVHVKSQIIAEHKHLEVMMMTMEVMMKMMMTTKLHI